MEWPGIQVKRLKWEMDRVFSVWASKGSSFVPQDRHIHLSIREGEVQGLHSEGKEKRPTGQRNQRKILSSNMKEGIRSPAERRRRKSI